MKITPIDNKSVVLIHGCRIDLDETLDLSIWDKKKALFALRHCLVYLKNKRKPKVRKI